jgi:uncharacterized membrane protein YpjA
MPLIFTSIMGWFSTALSTSLAYFGLETSKKVIILVAALAFMASITLGLWSAFESLLASVAASVPNELTVPFTWIVPSNFSAAISAAISMRVARALYDYKVKATTMRVQGT